MLTSRVTLGKDGRGSWWKQSISVLGVEAVYWAGEINIGDAVVPALAVVLQSRKK
jgi:hypothetical protein